MATAASDKAHLHARIKSRSLIENHRKRKMAKGGVESNRTALNYFPPFSRGRSNKRRLVKSALSSRNSIWGEFSIRVTMTRNIFLKSKILLEILGMQ